MSFFKRILGIFKREETPATSSLSTTSAAPKARPPAPPPAPARSVAVSWQEMLDAQSRLSGYILRPASLRAGGARVSGPELVAALESEGLAQLLQRRKVLVPVSPDQWQSADFSRFVSGNSFFLLSSKDALHWSAAEWREFVQQIRAVNGQIAIDLPLFLILNDDVASAEMLLLDIEGAALAGFEKQLRGIRQQHPQMQMVVYGVSTWDEYRFLMSLGVTFCVGPFATTPDDADKSGQISQSRLVVIEMLNMLRSDEELSAIAAVAKRDPAVVLKLLQMANSPLSGLSRQVSALEDAIQLLGRDALYRWLSLAMFRIDPCGDRDETLMVIALSRAAFLESLAPESDRQLAGELFLVGLFSLIDSLLSMPIEKVLEKMHLPAPVAAVLLRSEGPYARYLMLAMAMERCRIEQALSLCDLLAIDSGEMFKSYSESMAWANSDELS